MFSKVVLCFEFVFLFEAHRRCIKKKRRKEHKYFNSVERELELVKEDFIAKAKERNLSTTWKKVYIQLRYLAIASEGNYFWKSPKYEWKTKYWTNAYWNLLSYLNVKEKFCYSPSPMYSIPSLQQSPISVHNCTTTKESISTALRYNHHCSVFLVSKLQDFFS